MKRNLLTKPATYSLTCGTPSAHAWHSQAGFFLERVLKMLSYSSQALDHDPNHANPNHRLTVVEANFIISAQPARLEQPTERAFYHPSSRQHFEAFDIVATADNFQSQFAEGTKLFHPVDQGSQVTAVGPNDLQSPIHTHQPLDQWSGRIAVLHGGRSNHHGENQAKTVYRYMALAPRDLLACVVAAFSSLIRSLDRLTVHDCRCLRCSPPCDLRFCAHSPAKRRE